MSKSLKLLSAAAGLAILATSPAPAEDIKAGEKVFRKCKSCHAVGDNAKNKVGPQLNDLFGRTAGSIDGFKYSKAMKSAGVEGLVWDDESVGKYLEKPKAFLKGTKMAFAGLKKDKDVVNIIAYLKTFSVEGEEPVEKAAEAAKPENEEPKEQKVAIAAPAAGADVPDHGTYHLGRVALPAEIAAWDIDVRPDGTGLPVGKGTVAQGGAIYDEQCAVCHGSFGEGEGRWPVLAGGQGTLTEERPEKTIGSYWPYLSTVYDYVNRAMPFGNAQSLSDDDVYALTAYLLYLNDVVTDEEFELSNENFAEIRLPNEKNFFMDDREKEPQYSTTDEPCMSDCKPEPATVVMRARVLDVTPDGDEEGGAGAID
ncbi:c-type cytochrome [Hoeflea sp. TYP-13]|uniref:c-type cytochrome n=1 Tax=Hoeflea sp. TYP-13 TaxID=3230023 RepID=UPI0034C66B16